MENVFYVNEKYTITNISYLEISTIHLKFLFFPVRCQPTKLMYYWAYKIFLYKHSSNKKTK